MRFSRLASLSAAAIVACAVSARAADDGPPVGYHPDMTSDEAGLWMQADQAEKNIKTSPLLVQDPALNAYIRGTVCKLSGPHCAGLRFYIVEIPQANAYAMPNGAVVVWTGMLLRMQNEAQLALVLGHEMTHYFQRHSLKKFESARDTLNSLAFVGLAGVFAIPVELAVGGALVSYTRDQEREADAGGFDLATAAGYDPEQATKIWQYMAAEDKADPDKPGGGIFGHDHPSSDERLATLSKRADELRATRTDWITSAEAYRVAIAPFRSKWLVDEMGRGNARESVVLLQHLIEADPKSGVLDYYLGEAYRKRDKDGDTALAATAYQNAVVQADAPAAAWRGLGLMAMKGGDKTGARDDFANYLSKSPDADDRAMIQFYVSQLGT